MKVIKIALAMKNQDFMNKTWMVQISISPKQVPIYSETVTPTVGLIVASSLEVILTSPAVAMFPSLCPDDCLERVNGLRKKTHMTR